MLTGLNSGTAVNLQLGAGAILKSKYTAGTTLSASNVLSATNGGITFSAVPNFYTPTVDGASDNVKDLRFLVNWNVTLTFTAVEASADVILKALGCADQDGTTGVITGRHTISSADYANIYMIAEKGNGDIVQITLKNAMNTSGLSLATANNGNGGITFNFTGHYSLSALDEPPFEIEIIASSSSSNSSETVVTPQ